MSTVFKEATKRALGDYAKPMLEKGAIVPIRVRKDGRKVPVTKWKGGVDPDRDWKFTHLSFMTGEITGRTIVDYDRTTPRNCNVTTRRGGHIHVPYEPGDRNRQFTSLGIDVRAGGGLAVFYSKDHEVVDLDLRPRDEYLDLLRPHDEPQIESKYVPTGEAPLGEGLASPEYYQGKVYDAGYVIDVEHSTARLAGQVRNASQGHRNITLYRNLSQVIMIGGDPSAVIRAAMDAGMTHGEVRDTVASVDNNPQGLDVFDMAHAWLDAVNSTMRSRVAPEVVRLAIEQTSMNPFISQKRMAAEANMDKSTVFRQMKRLTGAGYLDKTGNGLIPGTSNTAPNNYRLTTPN